jgi:hypothetical protein
MRGASRLLGIVLFAAAPLRSAEISVSGISIPFFDANGKLTHRLQAETGTSVGALKNLGQAELVYLAADGSGAVVQRLRTAEATWDERRETLAGTGPVSVESEENRLTGKGFDFALETGVLQVHRDFKMEHPDLVLTSDRATVDLAIDKAGDNVKVRDIKRCEAIGHLHIVVLNKDRKKYPFDEAFSEVAIYDGSTRLITFTKPVETKVDGRSGGTMNRATIKLAPKK